MPVISFCIAEGGGFRRWEGNRWATADGGESGLGLLSRGCPSTSSRERIAVDCFFRPSCCGEVVDQAE